VWGMHKDSKETLSAITVTMDLAIAMLYLTILLDLDRLNGQRGRALSYNVLVVAQQS